VNEVAAFAVWLGAALVVLSDGRRALALGLGFIAAGDAVLAWGPAGWPATAAIFIGGLVALLLRLRTGQAGWGVMPPGSTPRLILSVVAGILALWIAASVTNGAGAPLRYAALVVLGLMGARVLTATAPAVVLTAVAALALAVAVASGLAPAGPGPAPYVAGALIAAGVSFVGVVEQRVA
jgi:hypothetical protein